MDYWDDLFENLQPRNRRTRAVRDNELLQVYGDKFIAIDGEVIAIHRRGIPKKGELLLRPTGKKDYFRVEKAQHDFQKNVFYIIWRGENIVRP